MAYIFQTNLNPAIYDAFVLQHQRGSILQESRWAQVKSEWKPLYCGVFEEGELQGAAMILCRSIPFGFRFGYIPRGPIMDYDNEELVDFMLSSLWKLGKELKMISIKFDPNIYQTFPLSQIEEAKQITMDPLVQRLTKQKYSIHHGYNTDMYDATQPRHQVCFYYTDEILEAFPKKTKEKINVAVNYHIEIEEHNCTSVEDFQTLVAYTEQRQGIMLRNADYFRTMMNAFEGRTTLLFAYLDHEKLVADLDQKKLQIQEELSHLDEKAHKKKETMQKQLARIERELQVALQDMAQDGKRVLISGLLLVRDNVTTELLYSGLNGHYRQYYAPYALRYHAIQWAFKQGCRRFNFGGVQGSLDDGLFTFKSSFHPNIDVYVGEFNLVVHRPLYHIIETLLPKLKQWKLKIARKGKQDASRTD